MKLQMADHHDIMRARRFGRDDAAAITQMARQVIDFADQTTNEFEHALYLRVATRWLKHATKLERAAA